MSKPRSGLYSGTVGANVDLAIRLKHFDRSSQREELIDPETIGFSQTSVNDSKKIADSMKENGWLGAPIDVVQMSDGKLTTIDNSRVVAARFAGIQVKAIVHEYNEPLPSQTVRDRFKTRKGGEPKTWGQAVKSRIGNQSSNFKQKNPCGSFEMEKIN